MGDEAKRHIPVRGGLVDELRRLRAAGRHRDALALLMSAENPDDGTLRFEKALLLFESGDYASAVAELERLHGGDSDAYEVSLALARCCRALGMYDRALSAADRAARSSRDNASARLERAIVLRESGRLEKALQELARPRSFGGHAAAAVREKARVFREYGNACADGGDHSGSIVFFRRAIRLGIDDGDIRRKLAIALRLAGRYSAALREIARADGHDGGPSGETCLERGTALFLSGRYSKAAEELCRASSLMPGDARVSALLAAAYERTEDYGRAAEQYRAMVDGPRDDGESRFNLARMHIALASEGDVAEHYAKAIDGLERALAAGYNEDEVRLLLGRLYREMGRNDSAQEQYATVIDRNRGQWEACESNRALNELEIARRETVLASKPRKVLVNLTTRCNLRCVLCGCDAYRPGWDVPARTLAELAAWFPVLQKVHWQGGEVFLHDGFGEVFREASRHSNLVQQISTNGLLLDEGRTRLLVRPRVDLNISVDDIRKDVYESIRRGARFDDLVRNIRRVNALKADTGPGDDRMITGMHIVVLKSNAARLSGMMDFAARQGFDYVELTPVSDTVCGSENIFLHEDAETLRRLNEALPSLLARARRLGLKVRNKLPSAVAASPGGLSCYLPWQHLSIFYGGTVVPFNLYCGETVGSIHESSLEEIWNGAPMRAYRESIARGTAGGRCARCVRNMRPQGSCLA